MKRKICMLLVCVFLFVNTFPAFASDIEENSAVTASVSITNEYDFLLSISKETTAELQSRGYSDSDISKIKNVRTEYAEYLKQFTDLDSSTLSNLGYTNEQIALFRQYTGTEDQIRALAATMSFSLSADYVTWSATENRTNARIIYSFNWSGVPMVKLTDVVAVSWNDWTINGRASYITYAHVHGVEDSYSLAATYVPNNGPNSYGGGFKFDMAREDATFWAKSGYGIFTLYHNYSRADLSAYAEYGHTTIIVTPSFSIPGYGSISFSIGTSMKAQDWADMDCEN